MLLFRDFAGEAEDGLEGIEVEVFEGFEADAVAGDLGFAEGGAESASEIFLVFDA